jgi:hypothetical protein
MGNPHAKSHSGKTPVPGSGSGTRRSSHPDESPAAANIAPPSMSALLRLPPEPPSTLPPPLPTSRRPPPPPPLAPSLRSLPKTQHPVARPSELDWSEYQDKLPEASPNAVPQDPEEIKKNAQMRAIMRILQNAAKTACEKATASHKAELEAAARNATAIATSAITDARGLMTRIAPSLERLAAIESMKGLLDDANITLQQSLRQITEASTVLAQRIETANKRRKELDEQETRMTEIARKIEIGQQVVKGLEKRAGVIQPSGGSSSGFWIFITVLTIVALALGGAYFLLGWPGSSAATTPARVPIARITSLPVTSASAPSTEPTTPTPPTTATVKKSSAPRLSSFPPELPDEEVIDQSPATVPQGLTGSKLLRHIDKCVPANRIGTKGSGPNGDLAPFTRIVDKLKEKYVCQQKLDSNPENVNVQICNCDVFAAP